MEGMVVVLIAVALVSGLSVALAGLLLVAERYLANYGRCTIDLNAGSKRLEMPGGQTLLSSLMSQGVFIPSACGGKGTCAYCKVRILEGGGPVAPTEQPLLTPQEIEQGLRISCQVKVRNDLAVEIPEELLSVKEYRGVVEDLRDLTHDIKQVRIRLVEPTEIDFVPGQYIQLRTPPYGQSPEPVYRAYSISSPPSDRGAIELIIRRVPGGLCTTWVFTHLRQGQEVAFNGPYGQFRLSDAGREMVWIAGGSGMAPFWSIVRHMKEKNLARPTRYFFGAVAKRDLFLVEELTALAGDLPWFSFTPALSTPAPEDHWQGETGLITEVCDRHVEAREGLEAYLCGSAGMIDASIKVLRAKGIPQERIFYDKFT